MPRAAVLVQFLIKLCKLTLMLTFPYARIVPTSKPPDLVSQGGFVWFGVLIFFLLCKGFLGWVILFCFFKSLWNPNSPMCDCNRVLRAALRHPNCCNCIIKIDPFSQHNKPSLWCPWCISGAEKSVVKSDELQLLEVISCWMQLQWPKMQQNLMDQRCQLHIYQVSIFIFAHLFVMA